jgi:shikimate dehydrogenase
MKKKSASAKQVYGLADLRDWSKATQDVAPPIRLGVFGDPVAHSLSPQMQNAALKHCQIDTQYVRFQISPGELRESLKLICDLKFVGVNLTVPHKIAALKLVDDLEESAKSIGAVNAVKIDPLRVGGDRFVEANNGKLHGLNTDGKGFARAIREEFVVDLRDLRVMILGAGGAARAIAMQCAKENSERLVIANRTLERGKKLADELRDFFAGPRVLGPVARLQAIAWDEAAFRFQIGNVDLIVNATPLGLNRSDPSPIPARLLAPHLMVYDTIYSERRTPFVSAAVEAGARGANGLSMLLHQGALAFETWFGREAPLDVMRAAL